MFKKNASRSGLFLLELIISILFFSMASAVCIRLFVQAHVMDRDNQSLTRSVKLCENFAEVFTASDGDLDALREIYPYLQRDPRSSVYVAPWRDMVSWYLLEEMTVARFSLSSQTTVPPDEETGNTDASIPAEETDETELLETEEAADAPPLAVTGIAVQDMLMFLDRDFNPCMIPQSGGYVLGVIFFEYAGSAGTQKNVSFGVWEYDTMRQIEVAGLTALTGIVDDDYFDQFSRLSKEDAVYLLDITIYVPGKGGSDE